MRLGLVAPISVAHTKTREAAEVRSLHRSCPLRCGAELRLHLSAIRAPWWYFETGLTASNRSELQTSSGDTSLFPRRTVNCVSRGFDRRLSSLIVCWEVLPLCVHHHSLLDYLPGWLTSGHKGNFKNSLWFWCPRFVRVFDDYLSIREKSSSLVVSPSSSASGYNSCPVIHPVTPLDSENIAQSTALIFDSPFYSVIAGSGGS